MSSSNNLGANLATILAKVSKKNPNTFIETVWAKQGISGTAVPKDLLAWGQEQQAKWLKTPLVTEQQSIANTSQVKDSVEPVNKPLIQFSPRRKEKALRKLVARIQNIKASVPGTSKSHVLQNAAATASTTSADAYATPKPKRPKEVFDPTLPPKDAEKDPFQIPQFYMGVCYVPTHSDTLVEGAVTLEVSDHTRPMNCNQVANLSNLFTRSSMRNKSLAHAIILTAPSKAIKHGCLSTSYTQQKKLLEFLPKHKALQLYPDGVTVKVVNGRQRIYTQREMEASFVDECYESGDLVKLNHKVCWMAHIFDAEYLAKSPYAEHFRMVLGKNNQIPPLQDSLDRVFYRTCRALNEASAGNVLGRIMETANEVSGSDLAIVMSQRPTLVQTCMSFYVQEAFQTNPLPVSRVEKLRNCTDGIFGFYAAKADSVFRLFSPSITLEDCGWPYRDLSAVDTNIQLFHKVLLQAVQEVDSRFCSKELTLVLKLSDQVWKQTSPEDIAMLPIGNPSYASLHTSATWLPLLDFYWVSLSHKVQQQLGDAAGLDGEHMQLMLDKMAMLHYWSQQAHTVDPDYLMPYFFGPLPSPAVIQTVLEHCIQLNPVMELISTILVPGSLENMVMDIKSSNIFSTAKQSVSMELFSHISRARLLHTEQHSMADIGHIVFKLLGVLQPYSTTCFQAQSEGGGSGLCTKAKINSWWAQVKDHADVHHLQEALRLVQTKVTQDVLPLDGCDDYTFEVQQTVQLCIQESCQPPSSHSSFTQANQDVAAGALYLATLAAMGPWECFITSVIEDKQARVATTAKCLLHHLCVMLPWFMEMCNRFPDLCKVQAIIHHWMKEMGLLPDGQPLWYLHQDLQSLELLQQSGQLPDFAAQHVASVSANHLKKRLEEQDTRLKAKINSFKAQLEMAGIDLIQSAKAFIKKHPYLANSADPNQVVMQMCLQMDNIFQNTVGPGVRDHIHITMDDLSEEEIQKQYAIYCPSVILANTHYTQPLPPSQDALYTKQQNQDMLEVHKQHSTKDIKGKGRAKDMENK
ncbi:hypothetical protein BD626DRAFT_542874 [Schizophyllum amplum]|uniref:Uncharacterized protein n=1 Tax=Schizophyllum amplum TaxID=97359 RepID=A0A550BS47_9AGAR|nr:hypothetical protein BD626DRAFT_542874 [Auriculariopsis ampla]